MMNTGCLGVSYRVVIEICEHVSRIYTATIGLVKQRSIIVAEESCLDCF